MLSVFGVAPSDIVSAGSVLAQLGQPDMRTPIAHALAYPQRIQTMVKPLNFFELSDFSFSKPEVARYPNLYLAIEACRAGQGATTALNAANEVAVAAFLAGNIRFTDIVRVNSASLQQFAGFRVSRLDDIVALDQQARLSAQASLRKFA